jgi:hypothetical protein
MARPGQRIPVEDARFYFTPKDDPFRQYPVAGQLEVIQTGETSRHTHDIKATDWAESWNDEKTARKHIARLLTYLEEERNVGRYTVEEVLDRLVLSTFPHPDF